MERGNVFRRSSVPSVILRAGPRAFPDRLTARCDAVAPNRACSVLVAYTWATLYYAKGARGRNGGTNGKGVGSCV